MHIMLATDFSSGSDLAFKHALATALIHEAKLTLIHVRRGGEENWSAFPEVRKQLTEWGLLPEGAETSKVAEKLGIRVAKFSISGSSVPTSLQMFVDKEGPDLLIVAKRPRAKVLSIFRKSVSSAITRSATSAVLVVPEGSDGYIEPRSGSLKLQQILVAMDHVPPIERAIHEARRLLGILVSVDADIELFHVSDSGNPPIVRTEILDVASPRMEVRPGNPAQEICARAHDLRANLVVMATQGRVNLVDHLTGSVTEQVLEHCNCPVLCVPS